MWLRGRLIAAELRDLEINVNCAPMLDVARPHTHPFLRNRCYGSTSEIVSAMGRAMADGMAAGGVMSVMKHIPGHGLGQVDSHFDLPIVTEPKEVLQTDFAPFRALNDLPMAMTAHIIYEAFDEENPATFSAPLIQHIREDFGFDGVLMSDDLSMKALSGTMAERVVKSLSAGCDIVLHCNGDMDEMQEIADHANLSKKAEKRVKIVENTHDNFKKCDKIENYKEEFSNLVRR